MTTMPNLQAIVDAAGDDKDRLLRESLRPTNPETRPVRAAVSGVAGGLVDVAGGVTAFGGGFQSLGEDAVRAVMPDGYEDALDAMRTSIIAMRGLSPKDERTLAELLNADVVASIDKTAQDVRETFLPGGPQTGGEQFLSDVGSAVGSTVPGVALSLVPGGQMAGAAILSASEGGRLYGELRSEGYDRNVSLAASTTYAAVSTILEKIGLSGIVKTKSGSRMFREGVLRKVMDSAEGSKLVQAIQSATGGGGGRRMLSAGVGEALTEMAQGVARDMTKSVVTPEDESQLAILGSLMREDRAYEGLMGFAAGTALHAVGEAVTAISDQQGRVSSDSAGSQAGEAVSSGQTEATDAEGSVRPADAGRGDQPASVGPDGGLLGEAAGADVRQQPPGVEGVPGPAVRQDSPDPAEQQLVRAVRSHLAPAYPEGSPELSEAGVRARVVDTPANVRDAAKIEARAKSTGTRVVWINDPNANPASSPMPGVIILNAGYRGDSGVLMERYLWHEAVHEVDRRFRERDPETGKPTGEPGSVWVQLRNDLDDLAPGLIEAAEAEYRRQAAASGRTVTDEQVALEGPSVVAEKVMRAMRAATMNPDLFARLGRGKRQRGTLERIARAVDAVLRRLGMPGLRKQMARFQKADAANVEFMAANLIREAVRQLERVPGSPYLDTQIRPTPPARTAVEQETPRAPAAEPDVPRGTSPTETGVTPQVDTPAEPRPVTLAGIRRDLRTRFPAAWEHQQAGQRVRPGRIQRLTEAAEYEGSGADTLMVRALDLQASDRLSATDLRGFRAGDLAPGDVLPLGDESIRVVSTTGPTVLVEHSAAPVPVGGGETSVDTQPLFMGPDEVIPATGDPVSGEVDGPMFAQRPDPQQQVLPGTEPLGRPDLANPAETPAARAFINEVDEARNEAGLPGTRSRDVVSAEADDLLRTNPAKVERALIQKVEIGQGLDDVETEALKRLTGEAAIRAVRTGSESSMARGVMMADIWRTSGTTTARALAQRFDPVAGPQLRIQEAMAQAMLAPPARIRKRLERLKLDAADETATAESRARARENMLRIYEQQGRLVDRIRTRLSEEGIDPRLVTADTVTDPATATRIARAIQSAKTTTFDKVYEFWINAILSGPLTHAANVIGNTANIIRLAEIEPLVAASVNLVLRDPNSPTFSEIAYVHSNMWRTLKAAGRNFVDSIASEAPIFTQRIEEANGLPAFAALMELDKLGGSVPGSIGGRAGRTIRVPGRFLRGMDELFKTVMGTMTAQAEAFRIAKNEGLTGEAATARMDELLGDLTSDVWGAGVEKALEVTFQTNHPNAIEEAFQNLRNMRIYRTNIRPLAFFMPFITTPMRIFQQGLALTPPGVLVETTAKALNGDFDSKKQLASHAITKSVVSLAVVAAVASLLDEDEDGMPRITGSASLDAGERALQYRTAPPLSIRVGGRWVSYARIEPIATTLAAIVDAVEAGSIAEIPMSVLRQTTDKTFLRGLGDIVRVATDPNMTASERGFQIAIVDPLLGFVPNIIKQPAREADSVQRTTRATHGVSDTGWWTAQAYRALPASGSPAAPPPSRDIWGRPIERETPFGTTGAAAMAYRMGLPLRTKDTTGMSPVDVLLRNYLRRVEDGEVNPDADVPLPRAPSASFRRGGEDYELTPEQYDRMVRDAGQRALEKLEGLVERGILNVETPDERDVDRVKSEYTKALSRERDRIVRETRDAGVAP